MKTSGKPQDLEPPKLPSFTVRKSIKDEESFEEIKKKLKPTKTIVKTRAQMFKEIDEDSSKELSKIQPIPRKMIKINENKNNNPTFTLMTHNILADCYTSFNSFPKVNKSHLIYSFRKQSILRELKTYLPDIICLQELEGSAYDDFYSVELSKENYESEFSIRSSMKPWEDSTTNSKWEGVAIFYKKKKFELIKKYEFYFNMIAYEHMKKGQLNERDISTYCMMSHNVALCLVLKSIEDSKLIVITTTHANWNYENIEAQLWQNKVHYEEIEKVLDDLNGKYCLIIAGDFNSKPDSKVYEYFNEKLTSSYSNFPNEKEAPITAHGGLILDYIWYSNHSLECVEILDIPEELRKEESFPSINYPSDHISLMSTFTMK